MINLAFFKNNILANVPAVKQVIMPGLVVDSAVDSCALLTSLLDPVNSSRVYAYKLPLDPVYPAIVYERSGCPRHKPDGYVITKHDTFIVSIQAESYGSLISTLHQVRNALTAYSPTAAAGGIEIMDEGEVFQNDLKKYEAALEVVITHLMLPSQDIPAYYLYPLSERPRKRNEGINCVDQLVDNLFVGLLVAPINNNESIGSSTLRRDVLAQIIGQSEPNTGNSKSEYYGGDLNLRTGSMEIWRDVFVAFNQYHHH